MSKQKEKDPAFLMYPSKWLSTTYFDTHEEKGIYIDLLCLQHTHGHLEKEMFYKVTGGIEYPRILARFKVDSKGRLYNQDMENEIERRKEYSKLQSDRAKNRWEGKNKDAVASAIAPPTADARECNSMRTITETTTIVSIPIESIDANNNSSLEDLYED